MPEDPNLELLTIIHGLQDASQRSQEMLDKAADLADENGLFPMTVEAAAAVASLLRVQSKLISNLNEQNQEIQDQVNKLLDRLNIK